MLMNSKLLIKEAELKNCLEKIDHFVIENDEVLAEYQTLLNERKEIEHEIEVIKGGYEGYDCA